MHICVIGAGVVGVTTAWFLANRGWQVTLVDACQDTAQVASHANGGQLSYSYVAPLAGPGVLPNVPKWLLSKDSPLRMIPRLDPQQWRWSLAFLRACNAKAAHASTAQLLGLSYLSRQALEELLARTPIDFGHARNGKMILYRNAALLDKARELVTYQSQFGTDQQILSADACVALEPALAPIRSQLAGAVYTPSEESGDCLLFTQALFKQLQNHSRVTLRMGAPVLKLQARTGQIESVQCRDAEPIKADHFIVAAGMGSQALLRPLGINPMLYPLKGYSLSVPCTTGPATPDINITDYERRTVYAKLNDTLRVAAMVGIGIKGNHVEAGRLALLKRQVHELLPGLDLTQAQAWAGNRPSTPDGKPVIGPAPGLRNLWLNTGHGALGFTLACGSAQLVTQLIAEEAPQIDVRAFGLR